MARKGKRDYRIVEGEDEGTKEADGIQVSDRDYYSGE